jgi:hypothetical protein
MKIVEVEWVDACSHSSWRDTEKVKHCDLLKCKTVGYLYDDPQEDVIRVAQNIAEENGSVSEIMVIPRDNIIRMKVRR